MKNYLRRFIKRFVAVGLTEYVENQRIVSRQIEELKAKLMDISGQNESDRMTIAALNQKVSSDCYKNNVNLSEKVSDLTEIVNEIPVNLWHLIPEHTHLSGKFFPYQSQASFYQIPKQYNVIQNMRDPLTLPLPPKHLWEGYSDTEAGYLETGRVHVSSMLEILSKDDFQIQDGFRVMEFGCAAARMLRWLADKAVTGEFWGVDICAEHMIWCQQNLSPPFHFFTTTTQPHLPFEDGYFDLIYAGSVFSHISELADFWFLELRRILKKGGRLYFTIHDRNTINRLFETNPTFFLAEELNKIHKETNIISTAFDMFAFAMFSNNDKRNPKGAMVFYDIDYLKKKIQDIFAIKSINPEAYGLQTALLLEKI
jgi:SAM-dependent methyltransferase